MSLHLFKIADITVSSPVTTVEFTSIPQGYTDLIIRMSARSNASGTINGKLTFNNTTTGYSERLLYGISAASASTTSIQWATVVNANNSVANVFSSSNIYIANYAGSTNKTVATESVEEDNAGTANTWMDAGLWSNSAAITSIQIPTSSNSYVANSTFTLYGVL
jgi:hypothetical protein